VRQNQSVRRTLILSEIEAYDAVMNRDQILFRIRTLTVIFIIGLVASGVTAIPLVPQANFLARISGAEERVSDDVSTTPEWAVWLTRVQRALNTTQQEMPFLFYGTDWLAFGHFAIAVAFIGAYRDPVRNEWLFTFGIIACLMIIPYAFIFGAVRGIPWWWRLIDCSFGVFGLVPLVICQRLIRRVNALSQAY
jgi:hypothetical protein